MTPGRALLITLAVITAVVVQPTAIRAIPLPFGSPQLVVVVVLAVALAEGPIVGAATGFGAGLLADVLSTHALGRLALVLTVAGCLAGLARDRGESALGEVGAGFVLLVVAGLSAGVALADAGLGVITSDGSITLRTLLAVMFSAAAYDAVITPLVFPPLRAALQRLDPTRTP